MRRPRHVFALGLALLCLVPVALPSIPSASAAPDAVFVAETSQWITGNLLRTWQSTPRAVEVLGYPISAPFLQESDFEPGVYRRVQYFERAVLEEHLAPDRSTQVLGRLLGSELARERRQEPPFMPLKSAPSIGAFDPVTRHSLTNSPAPFKRFYDRSGGLPVFGRPISEQFRELNRDTGAIYWVQYFERQRMEWHPEVASPASQIMLGRLGDEHRLLHPEQIDPRAFTLRSADTPPLGQMAYGINTALYYTDRTRALDLVRDAGLGWIRQQVHWKDHQSADRRMAWGELDAIVDDAEAHGQNILLSVTQAPDWATGIPGVSGLPDEQHLDAFAAFMSALADRYRGRVQAYEIWNEINLAPENGVQPVPPPAYYVRLLTLASRAIKANDSRAIVVSTPLAPTEWRGDSRLAISDIIYSRALFAEPQFWQHSDVVGVHVYGCANPPDTMWPDKPGPGPGWTDSREFYFRRVEDIRRLMIESGYGDRQVWITEFGWATANTTPGHEFGNQISLDQQAAYLTQAIEMGRYDYSPWIGAMFVWNLNFSVAWQAAGDPLNQMASYSVINGDWSARPAYEAIRRLAKP